MKLKEIRSIVARGLAVDITRDKRPPKGLEIVAISTGVYGRNGLLLQDPESLQLYAVLSRNACFKF